MNRSQTICFQFQDAGSAFSAYQMLEELGYELEFRGTTHTDIVIAIERTDLTSALEIAQAYGGMLSEEQRGESASSMYEDGYQFHAADETDDSDDADEIYIPAHTVAEDFSPAYMEGTEEPYFAE